MLCEVLQAMPPDAASGLWLLAVAGVVVGGLLWLAGARFSRPLVSIVCVCAGVVIGLRLPGWAALGIRAWGSAVAVAIVLGIIGYVFHRLWVGAGLGVLAALWACYAVIVAYPGQAITIPVEAAPMGLLPYLMEVGRGICPELHRTLPLAAGIATMGGLVVAALLPRPAMYLFYSLLGVTLLSVLGPTTMHLLRPEMLSVLPTRAVAQSALILGMVTFGAIVQWRTAPRMNVEANSAPPVQ
ncbi:MAG: hypothetical protein ABSH20_26445 [Tepidisphaeraceae bacterium]|jgi:hypothetical protein